MQDEKIATKSHKEMLSNLIIRTKNRGSPLVALPEDSRVGGVEKRPLHAAGSTRGERMPGRWLRRYRKSITSCVNRNGERRKREKKKGHNVSGVGSEFWWACEAGGGRGGSAGSSCVLG